MKISGLSKNSHGFWQYRPSRKGLPKGAPAPKAIPLGTKDEDEAILKYSEVRRQEPLNGGQPLKQWIDAYLHAMSQSRKHRSRTAADVTRDLGVMLEFFSNADPAEISAQDMMRWHAHLSAGKRSNSTVHRYFRYARAFFNWLMEQNVVRKNPASKLKIPRPSQSRRDRFCTAAQREAMIAACTTDDVRLLMLLGFFLGLRINEIVNARWSWFSADLKTCTVLNEGDTFRTKTGSQRMVPIHSRLREVLEKMERDHESFVVAPKVAQGKTWHRWSPRRSFAAAAEAAGCKWATFHTMRHTFGSLHAQAGTPEIMIRRWMGITVETWNSHYAGLSPTDVTIENI